MLHHGVNKHEPVAVDAEGEIFVLKRTAIETYEAVLLSEHGCELVHNAAIHSAIVVLGGLTDLGKLEFLNGVAVEKVVQGVCEA